MVLAADPLGSVGLGAGGLVGEHLQTAGVASRPGAAGCPGLTAPTSLRPAPEPGQSRPASTAGGLRPARSGATGADPASDDLLHVGPSAAVTDMCLRGKRRVTPIPRSHLNPLPSAFPAAPRPGPGHKSPATFGSWRYRPARCGPNSSSAPAATPEHGTSSATPTALGARIAAGPPGLDRPGTFSTRWTCTATPRTARGSMDPQGRGTFIRSYRVPSARQSVGSSGRGPRGATGRAGSRRPTLHTDPPEREAPPDIQQDLNVPRQDHAPVATADNTDRDRPRGSQE